MAESADPSEADITRLTAEELADCKYAIVKVNNPKDAYQGVQGGPSFMTVVMGTEPEPGPYWKPLSLQYRPFTADQDYVRKESLNPGGRARRAPEPLRLWRQHLRHQRERP